MSLGIDATTNLIVAWGQDRGILPHPDAKAQLMKTLEEVQELVDAVEKNDEAEAKDAIGDIYVTLVMQAHAWGFTMQDCVLEAFDQIKSRTGKMVDGVFVKDS